METISGVHCDTNWYEGNPGLLGLEQQRPRFSADAPALLGFDETIDAYCSSQHDYNPDGASDGGNWHASHCVATNLNILSLYGARVPYNLCRNLEWQVCAAKGRLPGQQTPTLVFSKAPRELHPGATSDKPFGQCRGWRDKTGCDSGTQFATDDIYFLEVCVFNQLCENNEELWQLDAGTPWQCILSETAFNELQEMLIAEPEWGASHGLLPRCDEWCNRYTCSHEWCKGCSAPMHSYRNLEC